MTKSIKNRKVRVVSGMQQGAEFPLEQHMHCVIGSDPSCLAVLFDENVAPRHCVIAVDDLGVTCTPLDAPVRTGDKQFEPGQVFRVMDYQSISIGNASLSVGPADGTWHEDVTSAAATALLSLSKRPLKSGTGSANRLFASVAIVIGGLVGCLGLAYAMMSPDRIEMTPSRMQDARRWLKSVAPVGSELQLTVDSRQHLSVSGYVKTKYQRELLAMAIHDSEYKPGSEIYATEEIVSSVARLARLEGIPCVVQDGGAGKVNCSNKVETTEVATKLKLIAQQVPGLKALDFSLALADTLGNTSSTSGSVSPDEKKSASAGSVVENMTSLAPLRTTKRFTAVLISRKNKWLFGEHGEKYVEGDEFNGIRIEKIEFDHVVLERDNKRYAFPIAALR